MADDPKPPASPTLDQFAAAVHDQTAKHAAERGLSGIGDYEHGRDFLGHVTTHMPGADPAVVADLLLLCTLFGWTVLKMPRFEEDPRAAMLCLLGCMGLAAEQLRNDGAADG